MDNHDYPLLPSPLAGASLIGANAPDNGVRDSPIPTAIYPDKIPKNGSLTHWLEIRDKYVEMSEDLERALGLLQEEHPYLVWAITNIIQAVANNHGYLKLTKNPDSSSFFSGVDLNDKALERLVTGLSLRVSGHTGTKILQIVNSARTWIKTFFQDKSPVGMAWNIGPMMYTNADDTYFVDEYRIAYSIEEGKVKGVTSHSDTTDPRCGIWEIRDRDIFPRKKQ